MTINEKDIERALNQKVQSGHFQLHVQVVDRKQKELCAFTETFGERSTIGEFLNVVKQESKENYLRKLDVNRIRLTLGDAKGRAMSDKRALLADFFTQEEMRSGSIVLVFKDLGRQISWSRVRRPTLLEAK